MEVAVAVTHYYIHLLLRSRDGDFEKVAEEAVELAELVPQPQPHVRSHLIVPRAASVQLASDLLADELGQPPLVGSMYVLIILLDQKLVCPPLLHNLSEACFDLGELVGCQDAGPDVSPRVGDAAGNVLLPEDLVVG